MTVSELIHALAEFPGDLLVAIDDADTSWSLNVLSVTTEQHESGLVVLIGGDYHDEVPRPKRSSEPKATAP